MSTPPPYLLTYEVGNPFYVPQTSVLAVSFQHISHDLTLISLSYVCDG